MCTVDKANIQYWMPMIGSCAKKRGKKALFWNEKAKMFFFCSVKGQRSKELKSDLGKTWTLRPAG